MKRILVVGSSNTDMVVKSDVLPRPGETILGGQFFTFAGGKGANQAVAAAKLDGQVSFLAKVGNDGLGQAAISGFEKVGIDTSPILIDSSTHSGVALILVDSRGENSISVASGANAKLSPIDIENAKDQIAKSAFILTQLETPLTSIEVLVNMARKYEVRLILNPAPAVQLSQEILENLFLITPNETEAEILTGIKVNDEKTASLAANYLKNKGVKNVIITLGARGAYFLTDQEEGLLPGEKVKAVDTTAAGDTFNGALTVALAEGSSMRDSILFANRAAALSVTKMGAQDSQPFRHQLETQ